MAGSGYSEDDVSRWFMFLDSEPEDGFISPQELRTGFSRYESATLRLALGLAAGIDEARDVPAADPRQQLADDLFDLVDMNRDGQLSNGELSKHLETKGYSLRTIESIFSALDVNNDGAISREELRSAFARYEYSAFRMALGISTP